MNFVNAKSKLSKKSKSQKQKSVTTLMNKPSPKPSPTNPVKHYKPCQGCGNSHWKKDCPFKDAECHKCKRKGHIAKVCFSKNNTNSLEVSERDTEVSSSTSSVPTEYLYYNEDSINSNSPFYKYVMVDGVNVPFEVDTGAARTVISKSVFYRFFSDIRSLGKPSIGLRKYGNMPIPIFGEANVPVSVGGKSKHLVLTVVNEEGPTL